ncbi:MAG TPA: hypothetical protein VN230_08650 [Burkholderiaceae bacterium]|nr:hypothetical protein [Burkholderiaceae bacterium]
MLQQFDCQDFPDPANVLADADPETAMLVHALAGCCHPKAARLLVRLGEHPDAQARAVLRADVLQLLTLAFGRAEALRRLQ